MWSLGGSVLPMRKAGSSRGAGWAVRQAEMKRTRKASLAPQPRPHPHPLESSCSRSGRSEDRPQGRGQRATEQAVAGDGGTAGLQRADVRPHGLSL